MATPSRHAALTARVFAAIRVTGGSVTALTVRLNGHPVRGVATVGGTQPLLLTHAKGLAVGYNRLFVSARFAGLDHPVQAARPFVVGYPAAHPLTASVRRGAGDAPAAVASLQAPLTGVHSVTAWLDRHRLRLPRARLGRGGHRTLGLDLAQLGHLRFGRNTLRLRVVMDDGRVSVVRRSFTLDPSRDIAVARQRGRAVVGGVVALDALRSRMAGGARLHPRWVLLRKPVRSHARLGLLRGGRRSLRPDVPGRYVVAMRTRAGRHAGTDVVPVEATYSSLMVPVDTAATQNGNDGLLVGDQFYAYDDTADLTVIQLDGYTLQATHDNTYDATAQSLAQMKSDLASAPPSDLVFVARPDGRPDLPSAQVGNLDAALAEIGGNLGAAYRFEDSSCWSGDTVDCQIADDPDIDNTWTNTSTDLGPFTVMGMVGMPTGQAFRETASQTGSTGGIQGYLTPGVASAGGMSGTYTLVPGPDPFVPVSTCASAGGDPCAVTVGDQAYDGTGADGVHVVILDRTTLAVQEDVTVTSWDALHTAINVAQGGGDPVSQQVVHYVTNGGQADQSLVIVQSVGNGALTGTPSTFVYQDLSELGGTPESLQGSLGQGKPYALVGVADNLPWFGTSGLESSPVMDTTDAPGKPTGQVDGMLQRDRTGLFTPITGSPSGKINAELFDIVFQAPQAWPYAGDDALPYIATNIGMGAYPDVRSGYTNLNIDFDSKSELLSNLHCSLEPFCGVDFNTVKQQLLEEFAWVSTVRLFISDLLSPYEQNGTGAIFAVDEIYDDVRNSLPPPPAVKTGLNWLDLVTGVAGILNDLDVEFSGPASAALSTASMGVTIADTFLQSPSGGKADKVTADAPDDLSAALADQQTAVVEAIDRLEPILLTDYGKLSAVGSKAGGGDADWDWTSDDTLSTITALNASTRGQSYTSLIPEVYKASDLEPDPDTPSTFATTNDVDQYACSDGHHPFAPALAQNQFHAVTRYYDGEVQSDVWTFANDVSSSSPQLPTTSLTDDIYGPDAHGSDGADAYAPAWWRTTYNPPGGVQCHPPNTGASWNAPSITLPLP